MIKCGKFLTIKKEGSANQSEGPVGAISCTLLCATLFDYAEMCQRPPKGSRCGVMEKCMGVAFPGTTITLPLRKAAG